MLRKNWTGWVIAMSLAAPVAASCGGDEDDGGDTNAMTATLTMTPGSGDDGSAGDDGSGDDGDDGMMGTTASPDDGGEDTMSADDAAACDPPCENGQMCVAGQCFGGGDDSSGGADDGGGCPAGETCQPTGGGGMACLGEPTHCVLPCAAGACPEPLACDSGGACSYDAMNLPAEGNADYPPPTGGACPAGFLGASFAAGTVVCIPECAAAAPQCPGGGVCAVNPSSSGMPC